MRALAITIIAGSLIVSAASFLWGVATVRYKAFPYSALQEIVGRFKPPQTPATELLASPTGTSYSSSDLDTIRQSMLDYLVPTSDVSIEEISTGEATHRFLGDVTGTDRAAAEKMLNAIQQRLVISGSFEPIQGWRWRALYLRNGGQRLLVIHSGHEDNPFQGSLVERAIASGFDVVAMTMPGVSWNALGRLRVRTWDGDGWIDFQGPNGAVHGAFEMLDTGDRHFIGFFTSPVRAALDVAIATQPYRSVSMVGLSGGGWTTAMVAALDARISVAISMAGTLPFFARQQSKDIGDAEQFDHAFYRRFPWPLIYRLATHSSEGRRSMKLVFNRDDPCCFDIHSAEILSKYKELSGDSYDVEILDRNEHTFDPDYILRALAQRE